MIRSLIHYSKPQSFDFRSSQHAKHTATYVSNLLHIFRTKPMRSHPSTIYNTSPTPSTYNTAQTYTTLHKYISKPSKRTSTHALSSLKVYTEWSWKHCEQLASLNHINRLDTQAARVCITLPSLLSPPGICNDHASSKTSSRFLDSSDCILSKISFYRMVHFIFFSAQAIR